MSRLLPRWGVSAALLTVAVSLAASGDQAPVVSVRVRAAQDLLLAVYPDLAATRPSFTIDGDGDVITLGVRTGADVLSKAPEGQPQAVVSARVVFDSEGEWRSFDARGPLVQSDDYDALRERVSRQPFQSASDAAAWLASRRAMYGPERAPVIEDQLRASELGRVFDGEVTIQPGVFQWQEPDMEARVMPGWTAVITQSRGPGRTAVTYRALLEPFSGRPIRIVRE